VLMATWAAISAVVQLLRAWIAIRTYRLDRVSLENSGRGLIAASDTAIREQ